MANAYLAFCDYFGTPARQDIAWDIENLFPATKIKTFNLKEFELPLATSDIRALCWALKTNNFFTDFVLRYVYIAIKYPFRIYLNFLAFFSDFFRDLISIPFAILIYNIIEVTN